MDTLSYKTLTPNAQNVEHNWVVVDATDQVLGRLCAKIALILRGKNKPSYSPNIECGDNVIVINADKVRVTGNKETDKIYYHHTKYPGGLKSASFKELQEKDGRLAIEKAVKGMLQHNTLGAEQFNKLKVYVGSEHPHAAQKPIKLEKEAK